MLLKKTFPILQNKALLRTSLRLFSEKNTEDKQMRLEIDKDIEKKEFIENEIKSKSSASVHTYARALVKYEEEKSKTREDKIQEFKDNFLFEKFLSKDEIIPIYDNTNIAYPSYARRYCFYMYLNYLSLYYAIDTPLIGIACIAGLFLAFRGTRNLKKFTKYYVEKVDFDPKLKAFTIVKRSFLGRQIVTQLSLDNMLYTMDMNLWSEGINYINTQTTECYSIAYKASWINLDLFSYLIQQNVHADIHIEKSENR